MDQLKDLLNNIKDRFTNPLFFSFAFSWLLINWTIPVSLLWYDTKQIEKAGFSSIYELILCQLSMDKGFIWPLYMALGYTFLAPVFKNLIRLFYTLVNKIGEKLNLKISQGSSIPFEKYLKLRENYDKRSIILEEVITKENEYINQYNTINTELLKARKTISDLNLKQSETDSYTRNLTDVSVLDGYWTNYYNDPTNSALKGQEEVYIENGKYFILSPTIGKVHTFDIINFYCDPKNQIIFFTKDKLDQQVLVVNTINGTSVKFNINKLQIQHPGSFVGLENGIVKVEYRKKSN